MDVRHLHYGSSTRSCINLVDQVALVRHRWIIEGLDVDVDDGVVKLSSMSRAASIT